MILPSCREVALGLARGDFDEAPRWRRALVRAHLWHCVLCSRFARQLGLIRRALAEAWAAVPPAELEAVRRRLLERFAP